MRSATARTAAAALPVLAVLLIPTTATATTHPASSPGDTIALPVRDALAALPVQTESRTGYERTKFRHWTDADRDGCSTRNEVLLEEAVTAPEQDASCRLTGGSWYTPYDDTYFTAARAPDIDHLAPLSEAWDSGASTWTAKERETYANDLDDPRARIAAPPRPTAPRPTRTRPPGCPRPAATGAPTPPTGSPSKPAGISPSTRPNRPRSPTSWTAARTHRWKPPSPAEPGPAVGVLRCRCFSESCGRRSCSWHSPSAVRPAMPLRPPGACSRHTGTGGRHAGCPRRGQYTRTARGTGARSPYEMGLRCVVLLSPA